MKKFLLACRRFLNAEEVPRWFGLSLIIIYFVGLTTMGGLALSATRHEATDQFQQNAVYSVKLLADRLSANASDAPGPARWPACGKTLKEFAVNVPAQVVRIVGGSPKMVVCSTNSVEVEHPLNDPGRSPAEIGPGTFRLEASADQEPSILIRVAIGPRAKESEGGRSLATPVVDSNAPTDVESYFVEAQVPAAPPATHRWAQRAASLGVVLLVLGALFLTYRCLREQLRGVSKIAHRLEVHRDRLEHEISSLRIGDEVDCVTQSWNQLVDMAEGLLQTSKERKADEELTRVLARGGSGALTEALHALPDGLLHILDETRLEYVNASACRLMGWKLQEARRPSLREARATGAGGKILDLVRSALLSDGRYESRMELVEDEVDAAGKNHSSYRVWVVPVPGPRRVGECLVVIRDVSQQLRSDKAREEFIAQVTHEFRTPLTNIRAYTETLSSGMFEDPAVISECYNVITKETRRLSRLIEDILSVSQLEVGSIELRLDNVDLRTLLTEGVRDLRGLAEEKNIDVQLVLPAKLEPIRADRDKLAVVLNNLLGNAIKYTPPGGNVVVGCQTSPEAVILTVKDNGMGISAEDQKRVFEKFQRGTDPAIQTITGTGLGLFTAREIIRRHGGDIELISEKGSGSTFLARLPHEQSRGTAMSTAHSGDQRG